jgi:hypothetical protein
LPQTTALLLAIHALVDSSNNAHNAPVVVHGFVLPLSPPLRCKVSSSSSFYGHNYPSYFRTRLSSTEDGDSGDSDVPDDDVKVSRPVRQRVKDLAKSVILRPLSLATTVPMPSAIAAVLREASLAAVEQVEESMISNSQRNKIRSNLSTNLNKIGNRENRNKNASNSPKSNLEDDNDNDFGSLEILEDLIEEAFRPMEASLVEMETSLQHARDSLKQAKQQSYEAIQALQMAAIAQAEAAATTVAKVEKEAQRQVMAEIYSNAVPETVDISKLKFDDVDYDSSEMAPPFLDPDSCLVPGEPVVRIEKAPENSRRIFAGIDIMASVDDVWSVRMQLDGNEKYFAFLLSLSHASYHHSAGSHGLS